MGSAFLRTSVGKMSKVEVCRREKKFFTDLSVKGWPCCSTRCLAFIAIYGCASLVAVFSCCLLECHNPLSLAFTEYLSLQIQAQISSLGSR